MKKFLISMLTVVMSVVLLASVFGCDNKPAKSSATAYDVVHGNGYLGVVDITINKDGKVLDIKMDEIFLPANWAKQATEGENATFTDTWTDAAIEDTYAKYIRIDDKVFEATVLTARGKHSMPVYAEVGDGDITDLEAQLVEDAELRTWYYEAAKDDAFKIVKKDGDNFVNEKEGKNNPNGSLFKSQSNYWPSSEGDMGWKGNIAKMVDYLKANGVKFSLDSIEKDSETGTFFIGDVDTGATLTDFTDYMSVAKAAYDKAMKVYA